MENEKKYSIFGMTCSMCSKSVENSALGIKGVKSASVSLMDKSLTIVLDENFDQTELFEKIKKLGYVIDEYGLKKDESNNKLKKRFIVSIIFLLPLMYLSMGEMIGAPVPKTLINFILQAVLAICVIIINFNFYKGGIKAVILKAPNMDTLVFLGSISAFVYSLLTAILFYLKISVETKVFFEASAMVLTLVTLGKWLEEKAKTETGKDVEKLSSLVPKAVYVIRDGKEEKVLISSLETGEIVIFREGDYVSVDGVVVDGDAIVDNSAITGESIPFEVSVGKSLVSGGVIKNGYVKVKVERKGGDTYFSKIVDAVKKAGTSKSPVQKLADKISLFFVPIVVAIALITFCTWLFFNGSVYTAVKYGISVLVISCPCSLGLATPVAITCAVGVSAKNGVLFKNASIITQLSNIEYVLFDKTATLTEGKPKVTDYDNFSKFSDEYIFGIVAGLEMNSNHPLKGCLLDFCDKEALPVSNFSIEIGKGLIGDVFGERYYLGNFVNYDGYLGKTVVTLSNSNRELLAVFAIVDALKKDSVNVAKKLKEKNIISAIITGDNEETAKLIAKECEIKNVHSNVLPTEKANLVLQYKGQGKKVAFVGDGINDAPALKTADVGVAIGTGTDIAIETADVVLVSGKTSSIIDAVEISQKTIKIIKGNFFWAFFYNVLAMPLAGGGLSFIGITLSPMIASICMSMSSLFVVLNALRIKNYKKELNKVGERMIVKVEGMMCKHCEKKVYETVMAINGVESVEINLKKKKVKINGNANLQEIITEIEKAGYSVKI